MRGEKIQGDIVFQSETRLQAMRRVLAAEQARRGEEPARVSKAVVEAQRAGWREAQEASEKTGVDYTSAYERMCRKFAAIVR